MERFRRTANGKRYRNRAFAATLALGSVLTIGCSESTTKESPESPETAKFVLASVNGQNLPAPDNQASCPKVLEGTLEFANWFQKSGRVTLRHSVEEKQPGGAPAVRREVERVADFDVVGNVVTIRDNTGLDIQFIFGNDDTLQSSMAGCYAGQDTVQPSTTIALVYQGQVIRQ